MTRLRQSLLAILCTVCTLPALAQQQGAGQSTFKVVQTPGGGQYIYGPLPGSGTLPEALVYMLRQIHTYLGDRPEVGKFFQSRDGASISTFFTAIAKTSGNRPITGLLIVSRKPDGSASAGVILDESARFAGSEPAMMKALSAVWQPAGGRIPAGTPPAASTPHADFTPPKQQGPAQLVQRTAGDRSAAISLPADWKLTSVASGTLTAAGPNGEMVSLGQLFQGMAMGPDLFQDYVTVINHNRQQNGLPPATYSLRTTTRVPGNAIQVLFTVDLHDGIGLRRGSARLSLWGPNALSANASNIPERFADEENETLLAVIRSFQQNEAMMAQLRQGAMNRVQADAARASAQSAALNARREASNAAFDEHMNGLKAQSSSFNNHLDDIDRSSKVTQDYILDRSVVQDTEKAERGTVTSSYAESLVRGNPDRFQIVPNQDLIRGKDY